MTSDQLLRGDLKLCRSMGVPPSEFLGLHRPGEPRWSEWDRTLLRALEQWEATRCPSCGGPVDECLVDESVPYAERPKFVPFFRSCRRTEVLIDGQDKQAEQDKRTEAAGKKTFPRARIWDCARDDERGR